ncbi:hypothetical protein GGI11_006182 [Coemansia sp. RSA 2049]|nr:hypothetical protein GGI11_006182 [Coemansia sp. RSA 2049]
MPFRQNLKALAKRIGTRGQNSLRAASSFVKAMLPQSAKTSSIIYPSTTKRFSVDSSGSSGSETLASLCSISASSRNNNSACDAGSISNDSAYSGYGTDSGTILSTMDKFYYGGGIFIINEDTARSIYSDEDSVYVQRRSAAHNFYQVCAADDSYSSSDDSSYGSSAESVYNVNNDAHACASNVNAEMIYNNRTINHFNDLAARFYYDNEASNFYNCSAANISNGGSAASSIYSSSIYSSSTESICSNGPGSGYGYRADIDCADSSYGCTDIDQDQMILASAYKLFNSYCNPEDECHC